MLREFVYSLLHGFKYYCFQDECFVMHKRSGVDLLVPRRYCLHAMVSLRGLFDKQLYGEPPEKSVVVDIGAWVGDTTLYYLYYGNTVFAVEPVPLFYEYLLRNVRFAGYNIWRAELLNKAYHPLVNRVEVEENGLRSRITRSGEGSVGAVSLMDIYRLVEARGFKEFFMKMDCEGCEYYLLYELERIRDYMYGFAVELHVREELEGLHKVWLAEMLRHYDVRVLKRGVDYIIVRGERRW